MQHLESVIKALGEKYRDMLNAQFSPEQAEILMKIWGDAVNLHPDAPTKPEISLVGDSINTDIEILRAEIKGNFKIVYITEAAIFTGVLFLCLIEFFR